MPWTKKSEDAYDAWMAREQEFAREEYDAVLRGNHAAAASAHAQRWTCMDKALAALEAQVGVVEELVLVEKIR